MTLLNSGSYQDSFEKFLIQPDDLDILCIYNISFKKHVLFTPFGVKPLKVEFVQGLRFFSVPIQTQKNELQPTVIMLL